MKVYMLLLEGGGDTVIRVIDREAFVWIHGPSGQPKRKPSSWRDPFAPASQVELWKQEGTDPYLDITIGSWKNDRALAAVSLPSYGDFDTVKEAMHAIKKHGDELADEYHGFIY